MATFPDITTLQKFVAAHASIRNHINQDRRLNSATCQPECLSPRLLKNTLGLSASAEKFNPWSL